jgi:hypothetical protein
VLTLGYSRKSVRLLTWRSSSRIWAELHEKAFRRLGSCPRVVVLDNLKEGVLVPDIYEPTVNPLFRDVLAHYGVVALPCRIKDPDRKGKVESGIGHAQKTYLDRWEERWADTRIHGTTKRQVAAMFAEEKTALAPSASGTLPLLPIRRTRHSSGRLRGGGGGVLRLAARMDRTKCPNGMRCTCASCIPAPTNFFANTCARNGADTEQHRGGLDTALATKAAAAP